MQLNLEQELNDKQCQAASLLKGPLVVIAGAGSGKTRMITYRIAHMLEQGISESNILALTFTNKAAKEMAQRVRELTGKKLSKLTAATFHAFGVNILRSEIGRLGYDANFSIYDQADKTALIKHTIRELHIPLEEVDLYELSHLFSEVKTGRSTFSGYPAAWRTIYDEYQLNLKAYNALDFDDLITMPTDLFSSHPKVLETYQNRYSYIMVDEFQDTSLAQYRLVNALASVHRNICVVGDDDQSIYSWRGANYENLLNFERDYPEVTEIKLEQNYRSTGTILQAANTVIANNTKRKKKNLWTGLDEGSSITLVHPENEEEEVTYICDKIKEISLKYDVPYNEFGVLVRTNTLITGIERHFLTENIPYTVSGGQSFFQRKEIKDIISYLRVLVNEDDNINLLRVINTPRRGVGRVSLELLRSYAKDHGIALSTALNWFSKDETIAGKQRLKQTCSEFSNQLETYRERMHRSKRKAALLREFINEVDLKSYLITEHADNERLAQWKLKNIEIFLSILSSWEEDPDNFSTSLYDFLNSITLTTKDDSQQQRDKVNIMTIHASKGLEFHTVFLAGAEDHIIPHARSISEDESNIEEERRLFYVAVTRARHHLFLTSCQQRRVMRETIESSPSRFIEEIPSMLISSGQKDAVPSQDEASDFFSRLKERISG
ncbi:MAG: ATP-dependent helicase [Spirochaetota bacterium]